ncbi:MAG TPA: SufD family Fe-S cluster assembly protein [Sphingopyxis sp.]|nr:SufD family Fe-S cluster assembly protein [Sphingopyxis sp.]
MSQAVFPTRRDESWRYSDLDALASIWPLPAPHIIAVAPGDHFEQSILIDGSDGKAAVRHIQMTLGKGATAALYALNIGGKFGRVELDITLMEGADFTLGCAQIGGADQVLELITTVTHAEAGGTSQQMVRNIVGGTATSSYLGKVAVARDAQKTDSVQDVKAMLLDRSATANAKPELEIFADDVKCAHGCAIGELDAQALYYLQSRGLPPAEAKKLLLQAFVAGVFDGAQDEERLKSLALAKLGELV